jgi:cytochrome c oxidase cbb3-type subunit 4
MNWGIVNGIVTAVLMTCFFAVVFWAYSKRRTRDFEAAANLPLADDRNPRHSAANRDARMHEVKS